MAIYLANQDLDLTDIKSNELMYKDSNGNMKGTGIFVENGVIVSTKDIQIPPNTLHIGDNIQLHENGGFLEYLTKTLDKNYTLLMSENADSGSLKPTYYKRAAKETNAVIQSTDTTTMNNVTEFSITPSTDAEISKIYFKLIAAVTNLKVKIEVNNNDVAYYQSKNAWNDDTVAGYDLDAGTESISLSPHFSFLTSYVVKIHIKADSSINLSGNGTIPYLAVDRQIISKLEVITEDKHLVSNTHYVNQGINDIQDTIISEV